MDRRPSRPRAEAGAARARTTSSCSAAVASVARRAGAPRRCGSMATPMSRPSACTAAPNTRRAACMDWLKREARRRINERVARICRRARREAEAHHHPRHDQPLGFVLDRRRRCRSRGGSFWRRRMCSITSSRTRSAHLREHESRAALLGARWIRSCRIRKSSQAGSPRTARCCTATRRAHADCELEQLVQQALELVEDALLRGRAASAATSVVARAAGAAGAVPLPPRSASRAAAAPAGRDARRP